MFSHFFIDRPIFATVISIVIVLVGVVSLTQLPVAQYPEVAPPTIQITTSYPGANAKVVSETVAAPIEQEVNGVEDMLYMTSRSTNDGQMSMDVTFELGTDLDQAQVLVQNRVSIAEAKLPEEVKRQGVSTKKRSPNILLLVHLVSEEIENPITKEKSFVYDLQYLSTYATTNMKDIMARIKGVGDVQVLGARDLSMRIWLDPKKLAARNMIASDVVQAIREQNIQVAAGRLGQPPTPKAPAFQLTINTLGRLTSPDEFRDIVVKTGQKGETTYLRDVVRDHLTVITLSPEKLKAHSLTIQDVVAELKKKKFEAVIPEGALTYNGKPIRIEIRSQVDRPERLVVATPKDKDPVVLDDVTLPNQGIQIQREGVELAARNYDVTTYLNGTPMVTLAFYQQPGANAVETAKAIRQELERQKGSFPPGLKTEIVYDTTIFIEQSINEVYTTLGEAIFLVFLVVLIFLQSWRATIIPMVAVPVSLVGTFAFMALLGFSLNNLSLFGLVLAIGIVVDDAIVVVENVDRNLSLGMTPRQATREAMTEIAGPVVATTLVMLAVFVPCIMMAGITGQFFKQFAVTISFATIISSINALTLSPALCALLLRGPTAKKDWLERGMDLTVGWFFRGFNWTFDRAANGYGKTVTGFLRISVIALLIYGGLVFLTVVGFRAVPGGFIPQQDKGYLIVNAQLPDGASLERTEMVMDRLDAMVKQANGVAHTISIPGYSILSGTNLSNVGSMFVILKPFEERGGDDLYADGIARDLRRRMASIQEAQIVAFGAPPVDGIGSTGGFKLQIKDERGLGLRQLQAAVANAAAKGNAQPQLQGLFSSFTVNQPQLFIDIDRIKAKRQKVTLTDIFDTLQVYLGSAYVNDITLFNRNWQVVVQADAKNRLRASDVGKLRVRNAEGSMVPLSTLINIQDVSGPGTVTRYNSAPSADISGGTAPGVSSGQSIELMEQIANQELPAGMGFEWTELTLQEIKASEDLLTKLVFPLAVVFVFLVLAAQYESWTLPLAIILIVPMGMLSAIAGVAYVGLDNNIFTQIGLVVLVGLAAKNAILIVEFARQKEDEGLTPFAAAVEASRLRLRPILMTAFSFILGVIPLLAATGAGAEMRFALGVAVFSGMLGVTIFGVFLTPVFYFVIRWLSTLGSKKPSLALEGAEATLADDIPPIDTAVSSPAAVEQRPSTPYGITTEPATQPRQQESTIDEPETSDAITSEPEPEQKQEPEREEKDNNPEEKKEGESSSE